MKLFKERCIISFFFASILSVSAQIKLPELISDGMILQRDTKIKVWGWASANEDVIVSFKKKTYTTSANKNGVWEVKLPKQKSGGPYTMNISASNFIEINDIYFGDVWIASGQSNMSFEMQKVAKHYKSELKNSTNSKIRQFLIPKKPNFKAPQKGFKSGNWISANPKTVGGFSAVAYFFAQKQFEKHKIPIGIINSSVGGSPAQAWISEDALKPFSNYFNETQLLKNDSYIKNIEDKNFNDLKNWEKETNANDLGLQEKWKSTSYDDTSWKSLPLPSFWEKQIGYKQGVVWFRKHIHLDKAFNSKIIELNLGRISDADSVFLNGKFIGKTNHKYAIRNYNISKDILKKGDNTIAIRVFSYRFNGGFIKGSPMNLSIGKEIIPLNNEWKFKLGAQTKQLEKSVQLNWKPTVLYNAMIAPLLNYAIKGVIWYQGEGNTKDAKEYRTLFPTLIKNWRKDFNQGDFPFIFVQLANYLKPDNTPSKSGWAMLREAQSQTLKLPKTGMAVIIDIGEENDIHPRNKKDVGYRLSYEAERILTCSKEYPKLPTFKKKRVKGNKIILTFSNEKYLQVKGQDSLKHFAIAGANKKFVWAKAVIKDNKIVVWSSEISNPVAVRYAWGNNPKGVNLYSKKHIPISPFRTDNW
tara:strand:+ start:1238 stop:3160 length:1923 start_codon:yes stop_codon:yes gene_type:complete